MYQVVYFRHVWQKVMILIELFESTFFIPKNNRRHPSIKDLAAGCINQSLITLRNSWDDYTIHFY